MTDINLYDIANYCVDTHRQNCTSNTSKYKSTLFVAITKEGDVIPSSTPHILKTAEQCILLHNWLSLGNNGNWYEMSTSQLINNDGRVSNNWLDNRFCIYFGSFQVIGLKYYELGYDNGKPECLISFPNPWESSIKKIWKFYSRIKALKTTEEIHLVAELFRKDEKILELEKQIEEFSFSQYLLEQQKEQYKSLLDKINTLITPINSNL